MRAVALLALAAGYSISSSAHEIDLGFNADAFRAIYATSLNENLRLDGGWLHDSDEGDLAHAGLLVTGAAAPASQRLTGGLGGRLALMDGDCSQRRGYALGVGGMLRWVVPGYDRFAVSGEAFFAPDILSGGDAEAYTDLSARLGYSVTRQADAYVGVRYVLGEFEDRPDAYFDTGMHAGINLRF